MSRRLRSVLAALVLLGVPPALSSRAWAATRYPLTLRNCGMSVTFDHAPARIVSIGQSNTEILLSLGLGERMVGTAVWFAPVLPPFEAANAKIRRLADNDPSFESVVAQEPDLVTAQYEGHVGPKGSVATREQFKGLRIPTYIAPADCADKDNTGAGDGVRRTLYGMELIYREIRDLAAISDVSDRGERLVAELERRQAAAVAAASGGGKDLPMVFWFSSREVKGDAFVAGKNGVPGYMLGVLGDRNVIQTDDEWPTVSWETIAAADPAVIVVARMDRRRFPADDVATKLNFLQTDPVASRMRAVRDHHVVVMDAEAMNPTIRTIDGIEALAAAVRSFSP